MRDTLFQLDGDYEILEKIREGGMGAIYKVRHELLDEIRIVKILKPSLEATVELEQRFLREARTAIRLRHPNVVQLYDFSIDEQGVGSIVMEFIDGLTVEEILKAHGPPPLRLTLEVARQLLTAVEFLHQQGFIHRDIAPDNIMLTQGVDRRPIVKLLDLGIAKAERSGVELTRAGTFVGKLRYASPEHFQGQVEYRSDIYSCGVVLYEMLTGVHPIRGSSRAALIEGHLQGSPVPFSESDPYGRIPDELRRVVLNALEKQPDKRPDSAHALRESLLALSNSVPEIDLVATVDSFLSERPGKATSTRPTAFVAPEGRVSDLEEVEGDARTVGPGGRETPLQDLDETRRISIEAIDQWHSMAAKESAPPSGMEHDPAPTLPMSVSQRQHALEVEERANSPYDVTQKVATLDPGMLRSQEPETEEGPDASNAQGTDAMKRLRRLLSAAKAGIPVRNSLGVNILVAGVLAVALLVVSGFTFGFTRRAVEPPAPSNVATSSLIVDAAPWAEVLEISRGDEKLFDEPDLTPLLLELPIGSYRVTVRSPEGGEETREVALTEQAESSVFFDFNPDPRQLLRAFGLPGKGAEEETAGSTGELES